MIELHLREPRRKLKRQLSIYVPTSLAQTVYAHD
jgi:hypothetical protein